MSHRTTRSLVVVAAAALFAGAAASPAQAGPFELVKRNGTLHLCANPTALPYSNRYREDGPPGFQLDLAEAVAREMGLTLSVDWLWERRSARKVDCDALMDSIILDPKAPAQGNMRGLRLTKSYASSGLVMVLPEGSGGSRFDDLRSVEKVGVVAGTTIHMYLSKKGIHTSSFVRQDEIVEAVARGEIPAGAVAAPYVEWYRHEHPDTKIRIPEGFAWEPDFHWNVAIGLWRADDALVDAVNVAIDRLVEKGTFEAIYAKYGVTYHPPFAAPSASAR